MSRPARRKAPSNKEAHKSDNAAAAKGAALADLITTAPRLSDPDAAKLRVSDWLANVSSTDSNLSIVCFPSGRSSARLWTLWPKARRIFGN
jgi:hypothetical protein